MEVTMDIYKKVSRLSAHLTENPKDYQSVIAMYKARSDLYEHERKQRAVAKLKKIAECRRILNERKQRQSEQQ